MLRLRLRQRMQRKTRPPCSDDTRERDRFAYGRGGLFLFIRNSELHRPVSAQDLSPSDGDGAEGAVPIPQTAGVEHRQRLGQLKG